MQGKNFIKIQDALSILCLSDNPINRKLIKNMAANGQIAAYMISPNKTLIDKDSLMSFIESKKITSKDIPQKLKIAS